MTLLATQAPGLAVAAPRIAVALLPVVFYLATLVFLDSFKLVALRRVLAAVLAGMLAAFAAYLVNVRIEAALGFGSPGARLLACPFAEELLKGTYVVWLIRGRRVGFLVDAAILGFAVGTGFAIVEQIHYLRAFVQADLALWIVRGFGTAVMHGGATALFAVAAQGFAERGVARRGLYLLPGLGAAWSAHAVFNAFVLPPALTALAMTVLLPAALWWVFRRSERSLRRWLGVGFDSDAQLLALINGGDVMETRVGAYLRELQLRFPGPVVADLFCLLRLRLELSIRAKGELLMREAGFGAATPGPELRAKFAELRWLERSVGRTGRLAILPVLRWSRRELWQMTMIGRG